MAVDGSLLGSGTCKASLLLGGQYWRLEMPFAAAHESVSGTFETSRPAVTMSASLSAVWGQALSDYPPLQCRCRSRARASLRNRRPAPFDHGIRRRGGTIFW